MDFSQALTLAVSLGAIAAAGIALFDRHRATMTAVDFDPPKLVKMRECEHCHGDGDIRVRGMRTVTGFDTCVYCGGIGSVVDEEPSAMEAFDNQQMSQQIADEHQALEDLCVAHGMTPGGLCMEWLDATLSAGLDAAMKLAVLKQRVDVELNRASQRLAAAETHEDSNNANVWGAVVSAMHRLRRVGK